MIATSGFRKFRWPILVFAVFIVVAIVVAAPSKLRTAVKIYQDYGAKGIYSQILTIVGIPSVRWQTTSAENLGLQSDKLENLRSALAARGTESLLVARQGQIVLEWYAEEQGVNERILISAAAKGIIGGTLLRRAVGDGKIDLHTPVARYVPKWARDPVKSKITVENLASHRSGLDDIRFGQSQRGWREQYVTDASRRFEFALERMPVIHEPGSQFSYSGAGYYVLAYALGAALNQSSVPTDLKSYLDTHVMNPLEISHTAWTLSYGDSYEIDGLTLFAIGSGAALTARAAARIGQLYSSGGNWMDRQILDSNWFSDVTEDAQAGHGRGIETVVQRNDMGWWLNSAGHFPSLPSDALVAAGANHQVVLVIPSLELVLVRFGDSLDEESADYWHPINQYLCGPLMQAIGEAQ